MSAEDYIMAWGFYAGGSLVIMIGWWQITKGMSNHYVKNLLRVIAVVLLFTPHSVDPGETLMAPALFVTVLDPLFTVDGDALRAGRPLAMVLGVAVGLYLFFEVIILRRRRKAKAHAAAELVMEQERQELLSQSNAAS